MSLHHIANHLASKGRNGDTTLVHMTNGEVAGLQALAQRNGTSLTINPHTGLPEAFGLKQLLPMAAGAALVASGVGAPMAAAMVGGGMWAATGSLQQGLMAGLGAYGGAGLAGMAGLGATAAGTQAAAGEVAAQEAAKEATAEQIAAQQTAAAQQAAVQQTAATNAGIASGQGIGATAPTTTAAGDFTSGANYGFTGPSAGANPMTTTPSVSSIGGSGQGMAMPSYGNVGTLSSNGVTAAGAQPIGSSLGTSTAATGAPETMGETFMRRASAQPWEAAKYGMAAAAPVIADEMAPKPYQAPVIKSDSDMGPRYAFNSGYDNSIPGRTGPASYQRLSNEEAKKLYGFAAGGDVQQDPNAQQVPAFDPVVRMAGGGSTGGSYVPSYSDVSYGMGPAAGLSSVPQGIAALSAPVAVNYDVATGYTPDQLAAMKYVSAPKGNPNANIVALYAKIEADRKAAEAAAAAAEAEKANKPLFGSGKPLFGSSDSGDSSGATTVGMAAGGISSLGSYSDGGRLLKGPGDGMSDNIPAQIGAKQPARLADGEFVVPADVVSHLGNGSTDAGAKQLYKMMDKVRSARTGRKAQGKEINPNKFMPA